MFLIGQSNHKEPLNVKVFQNTLSRFFIKLEKHVASLVQNQEKQEPLGYNFSFKQEFGKKTKLNDAFLMMATMEDLKEFFEPFRRENNSLANINQALKDLTTLAVNGPGTEKLVHFCLDHFKNEYVEDTQNAAGSTEKPVQLIENLIEYSRITYELTARGIGGITRAELIEKNVEILNGFKSILKSMREHDTPRPDEKVLPFPSRRAEGPA